MRTYLIDGVPVEVDKVIFSSDGTVESWTIYIGKVEIINSGDFLSRSVILEIEKKIRGDLLSA